MKPQTAEVKFTIRDYRTADFDRLWEIDQACFPDGIAYTQMELSGFITKRNAITLVAELEIPSAQGMSPPAQVPDEGRIAGFAVAHPTRGGIGRILTLDIVPQARRCGLASRLMGECEQRLRDAGCTEVYLETAVDNKAAALLYQKLGYRIVRTLPDYYSSHALDAFLMTKSL